jgi:hypothetical protein
MTTALIVIGVIAFFAIDAYIIFRVVKASGAPDGAVEPQILVVK